MTDFVIFAPEESEFRQCSQCHNPYVHKKSVHCKGICLWCEMGCDELLEECKKEWDKAKIDRRFDDMSTIPDFFVCLRCHVMYAPPIDKCKYCDKEV